MTCIRKIYFDCVSARFDQGKPRGPKLRTHSIVTIINGKRKLPVEFFQSFGINENINPTKDQYNDKYKTAAIRLDITVKKPAPEFAPIQ